MSAHNTDNLATLVSQRRKCLLQMRELAKRQSQLIVASDMSALMQLLAAKQQLITALQKIEAGLEPYRDEDPEKRFWPTAADREQCARQAAECRQLLDEVMAAEQRNQTELVARRDEAAQQLRTVTPAHHVRRAYEQQRS